MQGVHQQSINLLVKFQFYLDKVSLVSCSFDEGRLRSSVSFEKGTTAKNISVSPSHPQITLPAMKWCHSKQITPRLLVGWLGKFFTVPKFAESTEQHR